MFRFAFPLSLKEYEVNFILKLFDVVINICVCSHEISRAWHKESANLRLSGVQAFHVATKGTNPISCYYGVYFFLKPYMICLAINYSAINGYFGANIGNPLLNYKAVESFDVQIITIGDHEL